MLCFVANDGALKGCGWVAVGTEGRDSKPENGRNPLPDKMRERIGAPFIYRIEGIRKNRSGSFTPDAIATAKVTAKSSKKQ